MLTRGSSFYFPTSRVLHEIEVEGPGKRDGPQPRFTRYPLQHQAPRQHLYNTGNKYSPPPTARNAGKVAEGKSIGSVKCRVQSEKGSNC
ncbi:unnamed protein product [Gongylonema pulchrum]|uniref:Uncharacterized protein n=1 Tax=Gongylonema pulchrum TaxID=637853 RepID=A0A3P7P855_9BILA|nr:unnamed protein product [Gongylonema pulchrum]